MGQQHSHLTTVWVGGPLWARNPAWEYFAVAVSPFLPRPRARAGCPLLFLVLLALSVLALPVGARAAPDDRRYVQELRSDFARYDLGPNGALARLAAMTNDALRELSFRERREARFLRAAVAADLLLIAVLRPDPGLREHLAEALGVYDDELFDYLDQELHAVEVDAFSVPAQRARAALDVARGDGEPRLGEDVGTRNDLLVLRHVAARLHGARDPVAALTPLAVEPCAGVEGAAEAAKCGGLYARFPANARPAVAALEAIGHVIARLHRDARRDPLLRALEPQLRALRAGLSGVTLRMLPRLEDGVFQLPVVGEHAAGAPDVALIVERTGIRYGYVPGARLNAAGHITLVADGEPVLPRTAELSFSSRLRSWTHPIPELVELLRRLERDGRRPHLAIGTSGQLRAHVLGCVLISLRRAGHRRALLLAQSEDGVARTTPVELVTLAETRNRARSGLRLRVRQGGYSVVGFGVRAQRIPRVWRQKRFHFDVDRLARVIRRRHFKRADVSFMARVPAEQVSPAAFEVAERADALRVIFPGRAR